jgi:hypothetical protein
LVTHPDRPGVAARRHVEAIGCAILMSLQRQGDPGADLPTDPPKGRPPTRSVSAWLTSRAGRRPKRDVDYRPPDCRA